MLRPRAARPGDHTCIGLHPGSLHQCTDQLILWAAPCDSVDMVGAVSCAPTRVGTVVVKACGIADVIVCKAVPMAYTPGWPRLRSRKVRLFAGWIALASFCHAGWYG